MLKGKIRFLREGNSLAPDELGIGISGQGSIERKGFFGNMWSVSLIDQVMERFESDQFPKRIAASAIDAETTLAIATAFGYQPKADLAVVATEASRNGIEAISGEPFEPFIKAYDYLFNYQEPSDELLQKAVEFWFNLEDYSFPELYSLVERYDYRQRVFDAGVRSRVLQNDIMLIETTNYGLTIGFDFADTVINFHPTSDDLYEYLIGTICEKTQAKMLKAWREFCKMETEILTADLDREVEEEELWQISKDRTFLRSPLTHRSALQPQTVLLVLSNFIK